MSIDLNKMIPEIHHNAVAHGFWQGERDLALTRALIHSEWSEALEEYRAGRPMVWFACNEAAPPSICNPSDESECTNFGHEDACPYRLKKPEGIAVELLDGVIRILDLLGSFKESLVPMRVRFWATDDYTLPQLVDYLHFKTGRLTEARTLTTIVVTVCRWLEKQGVDWESVLMMKHEYNKSRPYLHGKKC